MIGIFAKTAQLSVGTFKIDVHDVVANDEHAVGKDGYMVFPWHHSPRPA